MMALGGDDENEFDAPEEEAWEGEEEELDLDEDESLPWLESSDYEEDEGVDTGRIVGFVILSLVALGLIIGLFWFFTNRGTDPELTADGSTIEAPEGAAKEAPEDPGGKVFDGTGDVAPAVGEGQTREGRLADGDTAPKPSVETPSANNAGSASVPAGTAVQVGALSSKAGAEQRWRELARQTDALQGFKYRIEEARIDNGTVYRLQAIAGDKAAADRLCNALKADGIQCLVK
ncbi:SPOR domain-containing protein [Parerythrobacter aestuarii]|uniref:SPOR domain-containing protein n=1 Tax=Parerythrobacter aestuarii TaxID=3020909 RepID=UPI0024DE740D|nr:SPOR domain-containing protein [Parerythrobacter aestuarii]